jgi:voltage-gated potassium channel
MENQNDELKNTTYEVFIVALTLLSIANLLLIYLIPNTVVDEVIYLMDGFWSLIFLGDFLYRLFSADSKTTYFLRQYGWTDLLGSLPLPLFKLLRLVRVVRSLRLMRKDGSKKLLQVYRDNRAQSAFITLVLLIFLVLEFGAMAIVQIEAPSPDSNINTAWDGLWYTFVTITTVGYGDLYPVTNIGRTLGMITMLAGVGLFGTFTGYLSNIFLTPRKERYRSDLVPETGSPDDPKARLVELKMLLDEQRKTQSALEAKINELEGLL